MALRPGKIEEAKIDLTIPVGSIIIEILSEEVEKGRLHPRDIRANIAVAVNRLLQFPKVKQPLVRKIQRLVAEYREHYGAVLSEASGEIPQTTRDKKTVDLPFSNRAQNTFRRNNINTIGDILDNLSELRSRRGIGWGILEEIQWVLAKEKIMVSLSPNRELTLVR